MKRVKCFIIMKNSTVLAYNIVSSIEVDTES